MKHEWIQRSVERAGCSIQDEFWSFKIDDERQLLTIYYRIDGKFHQQRSIDFDFIYLLYETYSIEYAEERLKLELSKRKNEAEKIERNMSGRRFGTTEVFNKITIPNDTYLDSLVKKMDEFTLRAYTQIAIPPNLFIPLTDESLFNNSPIPVELKAEPEKKKFPTNEEIAQKQLKKENEFIPCPPRIEDNGGDTDLRYKLVVEEVFGGKSK